MFLVFFIDFPLIMKHSNAIMYADDTVVYVSGKVKVDIERLLDEDLMKISKYFDQNELLINLKKGKNSKTINIRKRSLFLLQRTNDQQRCLVQILR